MSHRDGPQRSQPEYQRHASSLSSSCMPEHISTWAWQRGHVLLMTGAAHSGQTVDERKALCAASLLSVNEATPRPELVVAVLAVVPVLDGPCSAMSVASCMQAAISSSLMYCSYLSRSLTKGWSTAAYDAVSIHGGSMCSRECLNGGCPDYTPQDEELEALKNMTEPALDGSYKIPQPSCSFGNDTMDGRATNCGLVCGGGCKGCLCPLEQRNHPSDAFVAGEPCSCLLCSCSCCSLPRERLEA